MLEGIKKIGDFEVTRTYVNLEGRPVFIDDEMNLIAFKIQDGPIKEVGVNGCQIDTIIEAAKIIIEGFNKNHPCKENAMAIIELDEALLWLEKRRKDREARNVEGLNKE